ncbi:MAG: ISAs1 family transposase [Clostridia bacterium]|nr:ISAs1 family transposase [Clostridia bacterium]
MASAIIKPLAVFSDTIRNTSISLPSEDIPKKPIKRLLNLFRTVEDIRLERNTDYPLHEILMIAFFAILSGAKAWTDIEDFGNAKEKWLRRFMTLEHGIPSHDTFRRVFALIDPEHLQKATTTFLIDNMKLIKRAFKIETDGLCQYCVDGKEAKGTGRNPGFEKDKIRNLQTLHVYDLSNGICLVSKAIDAKTNEIPAAQEVLNTMQLKDVVVSFDALNTQRDTIAVIVKQKGDYIGALKGNQEGLFEEVGDYFTPKRLQQIWDKKVTYYETKEKAHNCIEKRQYYLTKNTDWFYNKDAWAKLRSFICYIKTSENIRTGKITTEKRYYISSLTDVETCADGIRGHWSVENQLHWQLDSNFDEDDNMTVDRNAFQNFSLMNKLALSLTKLASKILKKSVRATRNITGWNIDTTVKIFCAFDEDILTKALMSVPVKK